MTLKEETLNQYKKNVYSQFGEDGIVEQVLKISGQGQKTCVEFGAWDGIYLSNTANLWKNNWKAVLIECDYKKFEELKINTHEYACSCFNYKISSNKLKIDKVLEEANIKSLDLMSIDIDGNEYHIFESMSIKPRILICEFNPTIPLGMEIVGDEEENIGCSASALITLAKNKGYSLIAMTLVNCIFITSSESHLFKVYDTSPETLFDKKCLTYMISAYDGSYLLSRKPTYGMTVWNKNKLKYGE